MDVRECGKILFEEVHESFEGLNRRRRDMFGDKFPYNTRYLELLDETSIFQFSLAAAGIQSSGKSTILNTLIGYPILPTARTCTTSYAVEIRYGDEIRFEVVYETPGNPRNTVTIYVHKNFDKTIFHELKEYACLCLSSKIIKIESLQYFSDQKILQRGGVTADQLDMSTADPRHTAVLLMILLNVYVGQNKENIQESTRLVLEKRRTLFRKLNIPETCQNYSLKLYWNSANLRAGLCLLDLPGLDAAVGEKEIDGVKLKSHETIACEYIQRADAFLLVFQPEAIAGSMPKVLDLILNGERMKNISDKSSRIIPVINKADTFNSDDFEAIAKDIREGILYGIHVSNIYPISALSGDYLYLKEGFPFERTWYCHEKQGSTVQSLEAAFRDTFYYYGESDDDKISYEQFVNMIMDEYINKIRCLKGLELLRTGLEDYQMVIKYQVVQRDMLSCVQSQGHEIVKALTESIGKLALATVDDISLEMNQKLSEIKSLLGQKTQDIENSKKNYEDGVDTIEKEVAAIIKNAISNMQKGAWDRIIIDDTGNDKAKKNKTVFSEMRDKLDEYPVNKKLEGGHTEFTLVTRKIYAEYMKKVWELADFCDEKADDFERVLRTGLEKSKQDFLRKYRIKTEVYDAYYKSLCEQLLRTICEQVKILLDNLKEAMIADTGMLKAQNAAADRLTKFVLAFESQYHELFKIYFEGKIETTFVQEKEKLNYKDILRQIDIPFMSANAISMLKNEIGVIYNDYVSSSNAALELFSNKNGSTLKNNFEPTINSLGGTIKATINVGKENIITDIGTFRNRIRILKKEIREMNREINGACNTLKNENWCQCDMKIVRDKFEQIAAIEEMNGQEVV